jgi:RNA recognition motif-containing protein
LNAQSAKVIVNSSFLRLARIPVWAVRSSALLGNNTIMATEDARKLFVAGLPEAITEDVLRQLFEATGGKVIDVSLPRDRATGRPRGFGFVTFSTNEEAASARDSLDGSLQAGRAISVRPFSSEPPRRGEQRTEAAPPAEDRTLYVGNLPYDISQQELTQLLTDAGVTPIARIHLPVGPDGRMRGFGFVTMATSEAANSAIITMRNFEVRGRRVMANIAHPRGAPGAGGPGGGGPSDRPRPPRHDGPSSWSGGGGGGRGPDPYPAPLPGMDFSGRPVEGRRARASGTGPAAGGGGGGEWTDDKKKKKGKKARGAAADTGKRRDDDDWKRNDWDDDD